MTVRRILSVTCLLVVLPHFASASHNSEFYDYEIAFRVQVYETFRTNREEYKKRIAEAKSVSSMYDSAKSSKSKQVLRDWMEQAFKASQSHKGILPTVPDISDFETASTRFNPSHQTTAKSEQPAAVYAPIPLDTPKSNLSGEGFFSSLSGFFGSKKSETQEPNSEGGLSPVATTTPGMGSNVSEQIKVDEASSETPESMAASIADVDPFAESVLDPDWNGEANADSDLSLDTSSEDIDQETMTSEELDEEAIAEVAEDDVEDWFADDEQVDETAVVEDAQQATEDGSSVVADTEVDLASEQDEPTTDELAKRTPLDPLELNARIAGLNLAIEGLHGLVDESLTGDGSMLSRIVDRLEVLTATHFELTEYVKVAPVESRDDMITLQTPAGFIKELSAKCRKFTPTVVEGQDHPQVDPENLADRLDSLYTVYYE